jgi:transposase InsO family protein
MKTTYGPAVREQVRQRMSPPNRESVAEIARSTGIAIPTIYSWRHQWQKEGLLVPASSKAPEQWSAADKLAAVIQAAALSGTDLGSFCRERGLYPKQLARWRQTAEDSNGPSAPNMADQRRRVLDTVNDPRFADLTPAQIVAILAEERIYVGSEATFYRIMREEGLLRHRGRARRPREPRAVPMLEARGIHQVLAWDITHLPGTVKDQFYYLYMVMDIWSRRILGTEVHEWESGELARDFFVRVCGDEGINKESEANLQSDNGASMRSFTLATKMAELGVSLSFSRPRVSNDNAFAESLFHTMKYHQSYPLRRFRDLLSVRAWMDSFTE